VAQPCRDDLGGRSHIFDLRPKVRHVPIRPQVLVELAPYPARREKDRWVLSFNDPDGVCFGGYDDFG
jgi:hypothetical protein